MKEIRNKIKCPHCSEDFELEDVFKEHLDEIRVQQEEIKLQKQKNLQQSKRIEDAEKTFKKQQKMHKIWGGSPYPPQQFIRHAMGDQRKTMEVSPR